LSRIGGHDGGDDAGPEKHQPQIADDACESAFNIDPGFGVIGV